MNTQLAYLFPFCTCSEQADQCGRNIESAGDLRGVIEEPIRGGLEDEEASDERCHVENNHIIISHGNTCEEAAASCN